MDKSNNNSHPVVPVSFKGRDYMCIKGSKRADSLRRANRAWFMGYDSLASDLFNEALESPGCAFEAREAAMADAEERDDSRDGYWYDSAAYYNLYN